MNISVSFAVLVIGFAAGLRTFTAPAVTAWSAYLGLIDLTSTPLAFVSSPVAVTVFSLFALAEYVYDILPRTPPRTATLGLIARFVFGSFSAACLLAALGRSLRFAYSVALQRSAERLRDIKFARVLGSPWVSRMRLSVYLRILSRSSSHSRPLG